MQIGDIMKSYSNNIEGTAALQCDQISSCNTTIIDFEVARKSHYVSQSRYQTKAVTDHQTIRCSLQNNPLIKPFITTNEQRSSLVVGNKKAVALYTGIITFIFVMSSLLFM